ncbi:MAG: hypothetical protein AB7S38_43080 [Vulcanimicrobiota bacterium]
MNVVRCLCMGILSVVLVGTTLTPSLAQSRKRDKNREQTQEEKEKEDVEGAEFTFMDSTEAQWFRRSVNDSIYYGYTVNGVFNERDRVRLGQEFQMYKPAEVTFGKLKQTKTSPAPNYKLNINGRTVDVKD